MAKTSIHLKPCKWRSSEAHNRREKELDYVRKDLSRLDRSWVGTDDPPKLYSSIRALVKEKTGRAMQEKAEPLYEGVVVIDERTGIDDLLEIGRRFGREFGYKLLQAYIHADEGHYERAGDPSSWKPNLHAHLVFDRYGHETGKGVRTTRANTEGMQDICAEVLGMGRGLPSDKKHLNGGGTRPPWKRGKRPWRHG